MGTVKQIEVPEDLFEELESLRRKLRKSRVEVLRELIEEKREDVEFLHLLKKQAQTTRIKSEEEAVALANRAIARVRKRRPLKRE